MILKDCVTEPTVVNTVSYFSVSTVMDILASPEVIKRSFLQAKNNRDASMHMDKEKKRGGENVKDKGRFIPPNLSYSFFLPYLLA
jgi:hypothetical protein